MTSDRVLRVGRRDGSLPSTSSSWTGSTRTSSRTRDVLNALAVLATDGVVRRPRLQPARAQAAAAPTLEAAPAMLGVDRRRGTATSTRAIVRLRTHADLRACVLDFDQRGRRRCAGDRQSRSEPIAEVDRASRLRATLVAATGRVCSTSRPASSHSGARAAGKRRHYNRRRAAARADPPGEFARVAGGRLDRGRAARAPRRHVPRERARRGQARRLRPPRLELQLARHRRAPALGGAERRRASASTRPTATSSSRRRATTSRASTRRSTRSA